MVLHSVTTYYPNDFKTYLAAKPEFEKVAKDAFAGTDVHITTNGKRQLGAAIGSKTFAEEYVSNKVEGRTKDIKNLAEIALLQPHAAKKGFQKNAFCLSYTSSLCRKELQCTCDVTSVAKLDSSVKIHNNFL